MREPPHGAPGGTTGGPDRIYLLFVRDLYTRSLPKGRCMTKKNPRRSPEAVSFAQARDELFSHILRCGVIEALPEHQKEWFDDTMLYLADRYEDLSDEEVTQLRTL